MLRALLISILFLSPSQQTFAQCYQPLRAEGLTYEQAGNYEEAINRYLAALNCPDKPRGDDLGNLIKRALQERVQQLNEAREIAEQLQKETAEALYRSQKSEAEAQKQRIKAEAAKVEADSVALIAQQKSEEAAVALSELHRSNAQLVRLILENVRQDILNLEYEAALKKIRAASELDVQKEELVSVYLEIVFWYNEAGYTARAVAILDSTTLFITNLVLKEGLEQLPDDPMGARTKLRSLLKQLAPETYQLALERYYPVMIDVPGGTFTIGCDSRIDPDCRDNEEQHRATVSDYRIAQYETTWWQYHLFSRAIGRRYITPAWGARGDNPVVNVSWVDGVEYANWVSRQWNLEEAVDQRYQLTLRSPGFRLPTEAEWEYAAKGARPEQKYIFSGSNTLDSVAWYGSNSHSRTQSVGQLRPNALKLYDMSGNVWEWCWDRYEDYPKFNKNDYTGPSGGVAHVLRGGSWARYEKPYRLNIRAAGYQDDKKNEVGFRLARSR